MITFVTIFNILNGVFCTVLSLYHVWVCLGAFLKKRRSVPDTSEHCRIAALIPARNERNVIGALVASLKAQNYPEELFDIIVIPNNCTDDTAEAASAAGARVLTCEEAVHSKGDVLRQTFGKLIAEDRFDAFCIFDADNIVDPNFFTAVNKAYQAGFDCAQGFRESKNPHDSWVSGSMTVFYRFMSRIFNESRWRRGLSAHLNGTGFMVSARLIREIGWNTTSLTEDLEFTGLCGLNGRKIAWMEDAVVYDEQPVRFSDSCTQRRRWTAGSLQCTRRLSAKLLTTGNASARDIGLLFLSNLMNYAGVVSLLVNLMGPLPMQLYRGLGVPGLLLLGVGYAAGLWTLLSLAAYLLLRFTGGVTKKDLPSVLLFPLFMATWMLINLWASFTRAPKWKAVPHGVSFKAK
ncbi:MAG: glycosyltransferase family 2 protein [Clostridia bacterium]|nr:glycosyltransferase family 2 protein [Clostridia bacterium]